MKNMKKTYIKPEIAKLNVLMDANTQTVGASGTANLGNFEYGGIID